MATKQVGMGVAGCGGVLFLLSSLVTAFGAFHVFFDQGGGISANEAMPALIGGGLFLVFGILVLAGGALLMVVGGKSAAPDPQAAMAAAMQGQPLPPPAPPKPFPFHFLTGCASVFLLLIACGNCGVGGFQLDHASDLDEMADEQRTRDQRRAAEGDTYRSIINEEWYRERADSRRTMAFAFIGGGVFFLGLTVTAGLFARKQYKKHSAS